TAAPIAVKVGRSPSLTAAHPITHCAPTAPSVVTHSPPAAVKVPTLTEMPPAIRSAALRRGTLRDGARRALEDAPDTIIGTPIAPTPAPTAVFSSARVKILSRVEPRIGRFSQPQESHASFAREPLTSSKMPEKSVNPPRPASTAPLVIMTGLFGSHPGFS